MNDAFKDTNPKDAVGIRKAAMSVLSQPVMYEAALGMLEGARKYGRHNYRKVGVRSSVYYDAVRRHVDSFWEGEDIDPDSGLPHIVKAICTLVVLRDAQINGLCLDDRPPKAPEGWMHELHKVAAAIIDKYPNACDPITEADMDRSEQVDADFEALERMAKGVFEGKDQRPVSETPMQEGCKVSWCGCDDDDSKDDGTVIPAER